jgi:uncharacterized protein YegP (UPF0339 family)
MKLIFHARRGLVRRRVQYGWTLIARNGEIIGGATEGYSNAEDAVTNADMVTNFMARPNIEQVVEW